MENNKEKATALTQQYFNEVGTDVMRATFYTANGAEKYTEWLLDRLDKEDEQDITPPQIKEGMTVWIASKNDKECVHNFSIGDKLIVIQKHSFKNCWDCCQVNGGKRRWVSESDMSITPPVKS
jgi:sulfatase maturation enzyme AslB (radical SAM superfamily)